MLLTGLPPNGMNDHAHRLTPIGRHARVLLLNIQVVCSFANPLRKISLRQTRGDSVSVLLLSLYKYLHQREDQLNSVTRS
jgi:hypothetical protein